MDSAWKIPLFVDGHGRSYIDTAAPSICLLRVQFLLHDTIYQNEVAN